MGGVIKFLLNLLLIAIPINILGSAYSTLVCYLVMVVISLMPFCAGRWGVRMRWRTVFIKPLLFLPVLRGGGVVRRRPAVPGDSGQGRHPAGSDDCCRCIRSGLLLMRALTKTDVF